MLQRCEVNLLVTLGIHEDFFDKNKRASQTKANNINKNQAMAEVDLVVVLLIRNNVE
jgi:hypothetical protein